MVDTPALFFFEAVQELVESQHSNLVREPFESLLVDSRFGADDYLVVLSGVFEDIGRRVLSLDSVGVFVHQVLVESHAHPRPVAAVLERAVHERENGLAADVSSVFVRHYVRTP